MGTNLRQHNNDLVYKVRSKKTWFVKVGVGKLEWSAQSPNLINPTEYFSNELECRLHHRPSHPTLWLNVAKAQILIATFQDLVENLSRNWRLL